MSLQFGVKVADAPDLDPIASDGGGRYINYFKDGVTTIRILEELGSWTKVWMHFNQSKKIEYPCTGDRETCPGHNSEDQRESKASLRYIVNALDRNTGYVNLYKIPSSIEPDFERQSAKFGTLLDRDYEVIREKSERGTSYSIDRCDPDDLDISEHMQYVKDHGPALQEAFIDVWGGLPGEEDYTGGEVFGLKPKKSKVAKVDKSWSEQGSGAADDKPPFSQPDSERVEQDQEYTEAQLRAMTAKEVRGIYENLGIKVPKKIKDDTNALVDKLINELA